MSSAAYNKVILAPANERLDLFLTTANRLGAPIGNIEKDFESTLEALRKHFESTLRGTSGALRKHFGSTLEAL